MGSEANVRSTRTLIWKITFGIFVTFVVSANVLSIAGVLRKGAGFLPALSLPAIRSFAEEAGLSVDPEIHAAASAYAWLFLLQLLLLVLVPVALFGRRMKLSNLIRIDQVTNVAGFKWVVLIILATAISMNVTFIYSGLFSGRSLSSSVSAYWNTQLLIHSVVAGFMTWLATTILLTTAIDR